MTKGWENVHVVIGRLSDARVKNPHWAKIRDLQVKLAESFAQGAWVDTDDLNDGIDRKGRDRQNAVHYSLEGERLFAERMAEKALGLIQELPGKE